MPDNESIPESGFFISTPPVDDALIVVRTDYTKDTMLTVDRYFWKKRALGPLPILVLAVVLLYLLIEAGRSLMGGLLTYALLFAALFVFLAAFFVFTRLYTYRVTLPKAAAKSINVDKSVVHTVDENGITEDTSAADGGSAHHLIRYEDVELAVETDDLFILKFNVRYVCMVSKAGFERGTPEDFKRLLAAKLDAKKLRFKK